MKVAKTVSCYGNSCTRNIKGWQRFLIVEKVRLEIRTIEISAFSNPIRAPNAIGLLGKVTQEIESWVKEIAIECSVKLLQNMCLFGTSRIFQNVMNIQERENYVTL